MALDFERCYRAVSTRDARFDGQFFIAVKTTRIYCRPSCPAITPKRANVSFVPTAAAAQQAGYRACRRCLPDATPGSPLWNTRADLAARAMRLIGDGVIERGGVPALASVLGYSQRQLTRVLTAELGAGPLALARAHRAHTARLLIQTTAMPMSDIAFAAGFASIRQFNDTVREIFTVSPTTMRAEAQRTPSRTATHPAASVNGSLTLRLPYRQPLDRAWLEWFLSTHIAPGMELWDNGTYTRNLRTPHGHATARLSFQHQHVRAELTLHDMRDLAPTVARVRHLLDLDADPVGIDEALRIGPLSSIAYPPLDGPSDTDTPTGGPLTSHPAVLTPGIRVPGCLDAGELLLRTMIGQQISVSAAATHTAQLVDALGEPVNGPLPLLFPTPEAIAERGPEVLTGPARRVRAITAVAAALASGELHLHAGRTAADLRRELLALNGVGPWTADYVIMRLLADPDVLLGTDLVVRRGAVLLGIDLGDTARWAPWRSYLSMHLWRAALGHRVASSNDLVSTSPKGSAEQ
ncbi:DNA-3-methyladenine glycosylase 2 family protein [Nocardia sp. CNY236]|uniref:DNA-3-methyladenine glycosylase 2 family protein n=1 Tax=Nocardia sp. CNY236 TaxID=1169152 RepID=UPI00042A55FC|nr:Ada metal-binding domain-containing protein [Nocardia sp. CNY236]